MHVLIAMTLVYVLLDERGFPIIVIINVMKTPLYAFVLILNTTGIALPLHA